jgi:chromosome segregation ATPase
MQVAEQLEAQKKKCRALERDVANLIDQVKNRKANMDALRDKWLPALEELSERINVKFGRLFNYMSCEGEVHLVKGNEEVNHFPAIHFLLKLLF